MMTPLPPRFRIPRPPKDHPLIVSHDERFGVVLRGSNELGLQTTVVIDASKREALGLWLLDEAAQSTRIDDVE